MVNALISLAKFESESSPVTADLSAKPPVTFFPSFLNTVARMVISPACREYHSKRRSAVPSRFNFALMDPTWGGRRKGVF